MLMRTLKRELFIRWIIIEHDKWYTKMVKTIFGSKAEMRYVLSLKNPICNAWEEYCRKMEIPFLDGYSYWVFFEEGTVDLFAEFEKKNDVDRE